MQTRRSPRSAIQMKAQKKKKDQNEGENNKLDARVGSACSVGSAVTGEPEMPSADMVAEERAREAACERQLAELRRDGCGAGRADCSDSCSSDGEATLRGELRALRPPPAPRPAPRAAAALLPALAGALRARHDVRFLDDYLLLLETRGAAEALAATEELMRVVEDAMLAEGAACAGDAGGVVLASWLGAACAWGAPRVPGALPALHCLLQQLTQHQVCEVATALHAALRARELLAVSDAVRGGRLAAALQRAALDDLLARDRRPPDWGAGAGAPSAAELQGALTAGWGALDVEARLTALALVGRVMAGDPRRVRALLADLAPPSPRDSHDPDYLKVSVAVKTLQNLVKDM